MVLRVVEGWVHKEGLEEVRSSAASMLVVDREVQVAGCKFGHLFAQLLAEPPPSASHLCELLLSEKLLFGRQHVGQNPYVDHLFGPWIVPVPSQSPCLSPAPSLARARALYVPSHARVFLFPAHVPFHVVWPPPFLACLSPRTYRQDLVVHRMLLCRRMLLVL